MADLCNLGEKQAEGLLEREKKKNGLTHLEYFLLYSYHYII